MNPPGVYDKDDSGFYFIPTYNPPAKTSTFARRSKIRDRSSVMKEFPATSSSSRSRIICRMRFAASMETASSLKAGRSTAKRC